jgi:hypothetical protein
MEKPGDFTPVRIQSSVMRRNKCPDSLSILGRQIGKRYLSGRIERTSFDDVGGQPCTSSARVGIVSHPLKPPLEFYVMLLFKTLRFGLARRAKAYNDLGFPKCCPSILGDHAPVIIGLAAPDQM